MANQETKKRAGTAKLKAILRTVTVDKYHELFSKISHQQLILSEQMFYEADIEMTFQDWRRYERMISVIIPLIVECT